MGHVSHASPDLEQDPGQAKKTTLETQTVLHY